MGSRPATTFLTRAAAPALYFRAVLSETPVRPFFLASPSVRRLKESHRSFVRRSDGVLPLAEFVVRDTEYAAQAQYRGGGQVVFESR